MSSEFLLTQFKAGDSEAFRELYIRFGRGIRNYVNLRIPCEAEAEETAQEIFLRAYRFRDTYDVTKTFSTWLWTIAKNAIVDFYRKQNHDHCALDENIASPSKNAEEILNTKQEFQLLKKAIVKLTRSQANVIHLRFLRDLSFQEISAEMGISVGAAKTLESRAKAALR